MTRKGQRQVVLHSIPLQQQLYRWTFYLIFEIAYTALSALWIMGENVYWKLNFVDQLYTNFGTNEFDVWTFQWETITFIGIFVMILWNAGILGWLMDWIDRL